MKTLAIIDDEIFFRKSVCTFLNKQGAYKIVGEANNGKDGISLIQETNPDIALVDISMPVMSGLEMIQSLSPKCRTKFILSTGFEDFEYAKQAISLGVKEYLLKPLDNGQLLECLEKISREIDEEKCRDSFIDDYFQTRDSYRHYVALDFFHKSIAGNCQPEEYSVLKKQIEIEKAETYLVLLLKIHDMEPSIWDMETDFSLLHSIMENICMEVFGSCYPFSLYVDYSRLHQYMILGTDSSAFDISLLRKLCMRLSKILKDTVQAYVTIFCGTPHGGDTGIRHSYEEALSALHNSMPESPETFCCFELKSTASDAVINSEFRNKIMILLRQKNIEELVDYLSDYFADIQNQNLHIRQTWIIASTLLMLLDNFITECGQRDTEFSVLQEAFDIYQNCETIEQLKSLILKTYESVLTHIQQNSVTGKSSLIKDVQDYIEKNYYQPNLRLETIASHFYVSPQYLSSLFSQESHTTLTAYINTCRMRKAKELLLQQAPSIQNTAALCGFTDSGYFSKCFRKYYGISPKNFLALTEKERN